MRARHKRGIAALFGLAAILLFGGGGRAADPTQRWFTITTPHFHVHYYRSVRHDLAAIGQRVARFAEQAHATLAPLLRYQGTTRTHIVVTDDTDAANGSAQIVPYNVVRLFVTAPESLSPLNDYDDWLYGLLLHEYTHILHIDTIYGLPRLYNAIFGKSWAPNQIQPRWFIEGLATFEESERTAGGRVRSNIFDMILRTAVLEGKLLGIDEISSNTRQFPQGAIPYLYGGRFLKYIADRFGEDKLSSIGHRYAARAIPYSINRVAQSVVGRTFVELYADFRRHLERRYALQRDLVERRGPTEFEEVTAHGELVKSPRYSLSGEELVYLASDGHSHPAYVVLDAATGRERQRFDAYGGQGVTITPDGSQLVHGQAQAWRTYYGYSDLFVTDRRDGRRRRLTHGLRARDPDVSPDGRSVAFVTSELGKNDLVLMPLAGGRPRVLLAGKDGEQYYAPRWSPDGRQLVFSRWVAGQRDIYLLQLDDGSLRQLTDDRALDVDPVFSADGRRIYFSSDRAEIFNIYCLDLPSGQLWQVTNVIGGAFSPAVSSDGKRIYYVGFSSRGYDLRRINNDSSAYLAPLPLVDNRPPAPRLPAERPDFPVTRYSPLKTAYPRSWQLVFGTDVFGSTMGVEIEGSDVVGRHRYGGAFNLSTSEGHPTFVVRYGYSGLWPGIGLDLGRAVGPRGGLRIDGKRLSYLEENWGGGVGVSLPVLRIPEHAVTLSTGYRFNHFRDLDQTAVRVEPGELSPQLPQTGRLLGVTLGANYGNTQRYTYSVSTEEGRAIAVNLRVDHERLGSDYSSVQFTWAWAEYVDLPWIDDHVLALRLAGGIGRGDLDRRGLFALGGFPEQNLIETIIDVTPLGGAYLRGYPPGSFFGDQFHLLNVEYRLPLFDIERGLSSLPLYFNHVHCAAFADVGNAFFDDLQLDQLKVGVGAELLMEWVIFYVQPFTLRLGYARGLMDKGGNEFHVLLGSGF